MAYDVAGIACLQSDGRSHYQALRWKIRKLAVELCTGGFGKKHSAFLAKELYEFCDAVEEDQSCMTLDVYKKICIDPEEAAFDFAKISLFTLRESMFTKDVMKSFIDIEADIAEKVTAMEASLICFQDMFCCLFCIGGWGVAKLSIELRGRRLVLGWHCWQSMM
jgi:hypothetical protein